MPKPSLHNAPAVAYPLASHWLEPLLLTGLWLAGLVAVLLWRNATQGWSRVGSLAGLDSGAWAGLLAMAASSMALAWQWRRSLRARHQVRSWLVWDGQYWHCSAETASETAPESAVELAVVLDWQVLLLLKLSCAAGGHSLMDSRPRRWIWLWQHSRSDAWLDLRRALSARVRQGAAP